MVIARPNLGEEDGLGDLFRFAFQHSHCFLVAIGNERRNNGIALQIIL